MELAIAVLLISTLTTTGLLALWAATSRRHWFVRTAAFAGVLSPLLLVPAYEPFVALVLGGAIVAAGVWVFDRALSRKRRGFAEKRAGASPPPATSTSRRPRFSLATLLLLMVVCGVAAAVAANAPRLNRYAWQSVAVIGLCGGATTLAACWAATRTSWRRVVVAAVVALLFGIGVGALTGLAEWLAPSFSDSGYGWPPSHDPAMAALLASSGPPFAMWPVAAPSMVLLTLLVLLLVRTATGSHRASTSTKRGRFVRRAPTVLAVMAVATVAAPSAVVLYRLLTPDPIPRQAVPQPNGFDELLAAGKLVEGMTVNSWNFVESTATKPQLVAAVAEVAPAIDRGRRGLAMSVLVPTEYAYREDSVGNFLNHISAFRALARAYSATGRLAALNGDFDAAASAYLDAVRLGVASRRGGLIVDGIVGAAMTRVGALGLFEIHERLSAPQCQRIIEELSSLESQREPYEKMEWRDNIWEQHAMGWHGRLYHNLEGASGDAVAGEYRQPFVREATILRLLIAHLTLRAYRAEHAEMPTAWDDVTRAGLPALMIDPWDPSGAALRYRRSDEGYALYSVGPNAVDDGGAAPAPDESPFLSDTGDFRLDVVFAPEPAVDATSSEENSVNVE